MRSVLQRYAWLTWNKVWVLVVIAWVILIAWAMSSAMSAGTDAPEPSAPVQQQPPPAP